MSGTNTTPDLAGLCERLRAISTTDHLRGCEGRNYCCTCLWDEMNMATGTEAAAAIERLVERTGRLQADFDDCNLHRAAASTKAQSITAALARYDAVEKACPFNRSPTPPRDKPCPVCRAGRDEGCRNEIRAAFAFIAEARAAIQGPSNDHQV